MTLPSQPITSGYRKIGLVIDVFVVARCSEMQRKVVAKHLKSPDPLPGRVATMFFEELLIASSLGDDRQDREAR